MGRMRKLEICGRDLPLCIKEELTCLVRDSIFLFCEKSDLHKALMLPTHLRLSHPPHSCLPDPAVGNHMGQQMSQMLHLDSGKEAGQRKGWELSGWGTKGCQRSYLDEEETRTGDALA